MAERFSRGAARVEIIAGAVLLALFWYFFARFDLDQAVPAATFGGLPFTDLLILYGLSMLILTVMALVADSSSWGNSRFAPDSQLPYCAGIALLLAGWIATGVIEFVELAVIGGLFCLVYWWVHRRRFGFIEAATANDEKAMQRLLAAGAQLNVRAGRNGPLQMALENGNYEFAEKLLAAGAEIDRPAYYGLSALGQALNADIERLRFLLEHGADPNQRLPSGDTCLMSLACLPSKASSNLAKVLASVEAQARLLVEFGADPLQQNESDGRTALDYAKNRDIPALAELFESLESRARENGVK